MQSNTGNEKWCILTSDQVRMWCDVTLCMMYIYRYVYIWICIHIYVHMVGPHGGARDGNRTSRQTHMTYRYDVCQIHTASSSRLLLSRIGIAPSRMWLSRMLKRWRWSFKNINHKHVRKFMQHNILYYGQYLVNIRTIPMDRIKFIDEASFSSRGNCNQHNPTRDQTTQPHTTWIRQDRTQQDITWPGMTWHNIYFVVAVLRPGTSTWCFCSW